MWPWLSKANELAEQGQVFALVTVTSVKGSTPRDPGAKLLVRPDGTFEGTVGGGQLERLVLGDALKCLTDAIAAPRQYPLCFRTGQCCGGAVETFVEIIGLGPLLYVFGAGHVGQSLCQTLQGTPFSVNLVDPRGEWVNGKDVPLGVRRHEKAPLDFIKDALWDRHRVYVAIMTHDHQLDLDIVHSVIDKPARFIGLIGSETKWNRFQQRLTALGATPDMMQRVHCPIGVGTFGKAPREVAISAAAQLLQLHHDR